MTPLKVESEKAIEAGEPYIQIGDRKFLLTEVGSPSEDRPIVTNEELKEIFGH